MIKRSLAALTLLAATSTASATVWQYDIDNPPGSDGAGDITNVHQNLLDNVPKGWLYSTFLVPENTERMETLRLWLARLHARDDMDVVISHDPQALRAGRIPIRAGR